jgi:periplasmic divalent cation tolerance protein
MQQYGVVFVTAASEQEAEAIAQSLVQQSLAACVSLTPIRSIYRWQGEICTEPEWQLLIKTEVSKFDSIREQVQLLHSYEVPELIMLPIVAGSVEYLNWISAQVQAT